MKNIKNVKKLETILRIFCAVAWSACLIIGIINKDGNYRPMFIIATATLVVTNLLSLIGDGDNDRKTKRSDNKS